MQALVCQPDRGVALEERPAPVAGAGELVLRMLACGLCGTDLHKLAKSTHVGLVLGHEVVGEAVEIGRGVEGFAIGDRVVTPHHVACGRCRLCRAGIPTRCEQFRHDQLDPGGFSEHIRVGRAAVRQAARRVPEDLATEAAVFLEPAACVLRGIDRAGLPDLAEAGLPISCLVLGAGSMGLLHVLVLRALFEGVSIVVSEPDPWRRRQAERLGATLSVAPHELEATISSLEGAQGVDAAFDTVGAPVLLGESSRLLRSGGTLVLFAHPADGEIGDVRHALFSEERRLIGSYSGALDEQRRVFRLLVDRRLDPRPLVTHRVPLTRFDEALALSRDPHALKILLVAE